MPATRTSKHRHPEVRAKRASKGAATLSLASRDDIETRIELRLPIGTLDRIKIAANKRDVPYQSLIKVWLKEKVDAD